MDGRAVPRRRGRRVRVPAPRGHPRRSPLHGPLLRASRLWGNGYPRPGVQTLSTASAVFRALPRGVTGYPAAVPIQDDDPAGGPLSGVRLGDGPGVGGKPAPDPRLAARGSPSPRSRRTGLWPNPIRRRDPPRRAPPPRYG